MVEAWHELRFQYMEVRFGGPKQQITIVIVFLYNTAACVATCLHKGLVQWRIKDTHFHALN